MLVIMSWFQTHLKWFHPRISKKLRAHSIGQFKILVRINDNAYVTDLSKNIAIN